VKSLAGFGGGCRVEGPRLSRAIKIGTRTDKDVSLEDKLSDEPDAA
jgi:uncharacterized protein YqgV (UPF0045/DUF77 family)